MRELPTIEAINLDDGKVILEGGIVLPITNLFDDEGDECDPDDALTGVAGNDEYGWITFTVRGEPEAIH